MSGSKKPMPVAQFYQTKQGVDHAVFTGYTYRIDSNNHAGGKRYWRCSLKGCHGRIHTKGTRVVFTYPHPHDADKSNEEKLSITDSARVRANLLYNVIANAPRHHFPALIEILENLMNQVVQHVTDGNIMCVQIVPVDSNVRMSEFLTLSDLVSSASSTRFNKPYPIEEHNETSKNVRLKPCSVIIEQLDNGDIQKVAGKRLTGPVALANIKKEVMDSEEEENSTESQDEQEAIRALALGLKTEQVTEEGKDSTMMTSFMTRSRKNDHYGDELADSEDIDDTNGDDFMDGLDSGGDNVRQLEKLTKTVRPMVDDYSMSEDDAQDEEMHSDDEWRPTDRRKRKSSKRPKKRRRLSSGPHSSPVCHSKSRPKPVELYISSEEYEESSHDVTSKTNIYMKSDLYENYDLDKMFDETIQRRCFLCPTQSVIETVEVKSLNGFIEHIAEAYHMEYTDTLIRIMKCPVCEMQIKNKENVQGGPEKHQILRLAGAVLQHMEREHCFETENTFMCKYQCEKCFYSTFECQIFLEHIRNSHEYEKIASKTNKSIIALEKFESCSMDVEFPEDVNNACPFCPANSAHKAMTLHNFVKHIIEEQRHIATVDTPDGTKQTLSCPECHLEFVSQILTTNNEDDIQLLQLVRKAVHHMMSEHNYIPDEAFIPMYKCDVCNMSSYDQDNILKHYSTDHKDTNSTESNLDPDVLLEKYLPADFATPYADDIDSVCPFCPKDSLNLRYKSNCLSDFLRHVKEVEHFVHGDGPLYSISCADCSKIQKSWIYDMNDLQALKMVGMIVNHMHSEHDLAISPGFLPKYQCEYCVFFSYSSIDFKDHMQCMHYIRREDANSVDNNSGEENVPSTKWFPERGILLNSVFIDSVDSSCPFCDESDPYKAKTLADLIQHVDISGHLIKDVDGSYIQCQRCDRRLKSHIEIAGKKSMQMLRIIGKAVHHLYVFHKCRFEEGFLPVYECSKCVYNSYSGEQLIKHRDVAHVVYLPKAVGKPDIQIPRAVVDKPAEKHDGYSYLGFTNKSRNDLCNLHLSNSIYENQNKTIFSYDEPLNPALNPVCPLCPNATEVFLNMKSFGYHCAETHVLSENTLVTIDCPECETTLACKTYKRDEPLSLAMGLIGKWIEHRAKKHSWTVPLFLPLFKCHGCSEFSTYSPRGCIVHIHTPGKCRVNSDDVGLFMKPCPSCQKFIGYRSWSAHVQLCSKPENERKRTACPVCGKLFLDELPYHKSNLKNHIAMVHGDYFPHLCSICSTQFKRRNDLNRHVFMVHNINISNNEPLYCEECDFKTLIQSQLNRHLRIHDEAHRVTCQYCGKQYKGEAHLKRHIEDVHEKSEEQYCCNQCSYTTNSRRYLQKHIRWHDSTKLGAGHWCTICNYNARFPSVLKFHLKNVHKLDMEGIDVGNHPSVKSVVLKRRYKNRRVPGESSTDVMYSTSAINHTVAVVEAALANRESDNGGDVLDRDAHMDVDSGDNSGRHPPEHSGGDGDLPQLVASSPAVCISSSSCSQPTGYAVESSSTVIPATTSLATAMPQLPEHIASSSGHKRQSQRDDEPMYSSTEILSAPPAHNHHRQMGIGSTMNRATIPPSSSMLGHPLSQTPTQQTSDYLYTQQVFGSFFQPTGLPPPQGLPHQYY